jgi:ATP-dependent exoDNAse (exonuclease V) alpha subunit
MISPAEIKVKAERKYISFLQSTIQEIPFSRIVIRGDKSYSKSLSEYEKEILALLNQSKEKKGCGYTIDYQTVKTKLIGIQSLPVCIYFDSEKDFLKYLGKEKEIDSFRQNCAKILLTLPELKNWIIQNPVNNPKSE